MNYHEDTIVAKATAPGTAALGIVRISGTAAFEVLAKLTGKAVSLESHSIRLRKIYSESGQIDEGLVAAFKAPFSYTGEDMAELYVHGSDFIISEIIRYAMASGCRMAEAGEFTLRAFLNGKLDLAQAEAVGDLIAAENSGAHNLALKQLKGGVSNKIKELRARLLEFTALVELELDFGEEDVEFADRQRLLEMVNNLDNEVDALLGTFNSGNAIKEGVPVAIAGKPNAGKSTLLNTLLKEDRAIVTDIPGTTRDTIEEYFLLNGIKFRLIDTAGIREAADTVESLGIQRTFESISKAAIVLLLVDATCESEAEVEKLKAEIKSKTSAEIWVLGNKADLPGLGYQAELSISAKTGNISALLHKLEDYAYGLLNHSGDVTISNLRHAEALANAQRELQNVKMVMESGQSGDILAFELRNAMAELGKITGEIDSDEILGEIFSRFCIGK